MSEEEQIGRIEDYLFDRMTPVDKNAFESDLASDPSLNQLYGEHKYFLDGIAGMKLKSMEDKLRREGNGSGLVIAQRRNVVRNISIAATILLLTGIYFIFFHASGMQRLAREYYSAPFAQIQRSDAPPEDSLFQAGMAAFGRKDWEAAIKAFAGIAKDHQFYERSLYYTAHALAGNGDFELALGVFYNPYFHNNQYGEQAEWNSILMSMQLNHPEKEIIADLKAIENTPGHFYQAKAKELREKLEEK